MSTIDERRERAPAGVALVHDTDGWYGDFARPRVVLSPIAAPSVLGLFGFAGATFIVAANLAGWYGSKASPGYLFPFAMFFGGLVVATAMHGMWGSFWLGYGLLQLLVATKTLSTGTTTDHALGFWFIALCAITASGMFAALAEGNLGVTAVLGTLAAGCGLAAVGFLNGHAYIQHFAGCDLGRAHVVHGLGDELKAAAGRTVLPLFKLQSEANMPGGHPTRPIQLEWGEPGVKMGQ